MKTKSGFAASEFFVTILNTSVEIIR